MKIRAAKKKAAKKRSLLDRSVTATGLQRARLLRQANNNIYEYALDSGLDRDSVEYLERQFGQSRSVVIECVNQLKMGFEVRVKHIQHFLHLLISHIFFFIV